MTDIVFVLYPDFTQLDFAGPYEIFCRMSDVRVRLASPEGGDLRTERGLVFRDLERLADIDRCDLLCIPGGADQRAVTEPDALGHIRRLATSATYITSVCNGSLVLAAAGLLRGRRAACHWAMGSLLEEHGAEYDKRRVVDDGDLITGAGVTSGIDFALRCVAKLRGDVAAQLIQLTIEYAPEPPFDSGRPDTAPAEVMAAFSQIASPR